MSRVFAAGLGDQNMVIEDVTIQTETSRGRNPVTSEVLVSAVRPQASQASRCSRCRRRCPGYDGGDGTRRWRTLDVGTMKAYLQAAAPRVQCGEHGVVVAHVRWARPGARHTWAFEDTCAWLAAHTAMSVLTVLPRIAWRTAAGIVTRVVTDGHDPNDLLSGLVRIGIDEIAYRKGHRYHGRGRPRDRPAGVGGRGPQPRHPGEVRRLAGRRAGHAAHHVSCDGAQWIHSLVGERAPAAIICLDPLPRRGLGDQGLDRVGVRTMTKAGITDRHAMWAVRKNPPDLSTEQRSSLAENRHHQQDALPGVSAQRATARGVPGQSRQGRQLLAGRLSWASHSGIPEFVTLAASIRRYRDLIHNTLDHALSNARSEATDTHLRALTKRAYGFHSLDTLIAMALLTRGGLCPPLPGPTA